MDRLFVENLLMKLAIAYWLNGSFLNNWIHSEWYFWPVLETLHFIGLCLLLSGLLVVDLRLMGFFKTLSLDMAKRYIRITLFGFLINFLTGICFLAGNTWKYAQGNMAFDLKLMLMFILGLNAIIFHSKFQTILDGNDVTVISRIIGGVSLLLWCLVIVCGRMITFFATNP